MMFPLPDQPTAEELVGAEYEVQDGVMLTAVESEESTMPCNADMEKIIADVVGGSYYMNLAARDKAK